MCGYRRENEAVKTRLEKGFGKRFVYLQELSWNHKVRIISRCCGKQLADELPVLDTVCYACLFPANGDEW